MPPDVLSYTLENKPNIPESFAPTNAAWARLCPKLVIGSNAPAPTKSTIES